MLPILISEMPYRKLKFENDKIYHIFNKSTANAVIFKTTRDYDRAVESLVFYTFKNPPLRYSHFKRLSQERKQEFYENLDSTNTNIEVLAYSFLPNHYHLLVKQKSENGTSKAIRNFQNSYAKYYNTKAQSAGAVFTALFKAREVQGSEELKILSKFIHLCPVLSKSTRLDRLPEYKWSSYPEYLDPEEGSLLTTSPVLSQFPNAQEYKIYVSNLEDIKAEFEPVKNQFIEKVQI